MKLLNLGAGQRESVAVPGSRQHWQIWMNLPVFPAQHLIDCPQKVLKTDAGFRTDGNDGWVSIGSILKRLQIF